jgi:hypothetical protein
MTMHAVAADTGWQAYALNGRPDLLNYMRRGDVTWSDLWRFYRANPADPSAVVRLIGLFHMFLSQDYDREGCVLDPDGDVYPRLHEWASFVVECGDFIPEEKLRESLADLLGRSLVSPLYYEAVFNAYVEAELHHLAAVQALPAVSLDAPDKKATYHGRLAVHMHEDGLNPHVPAGSSHQHFSALVGRHYAAWDQAFTLALGEDETDWLDEGGEG